MGLHGLFDSVATVWRPEATADAMGDIPGTLRATGQHKCAVSRGSMTSFDDGAGERESGYTTLFFDKRVALEIRDVIQVVRGPEVGTWWVVISTSTPRGRHREAKAIPYDGKKPNG